MGKLFHKFFYVPKYGKVQEHVLLARLIMMITVVIMCLAAMGITAYAYFSHNVTSGSSVIRTARFEADVQITITDANHTPVTVVKEGKLHTATLQSGTYTVELTKGKSTAKTGFCIITIGDKQYYTQQIGVDVKRNLDNASVNFTLKVSSDTKIKILSHWGTSSCYGYEEASNNPVYLKSGNTVDLTTPSAGNQNPPATEQQDTTESTTTTKPTDTQTQESTTVPTESVPPETTEPSSATEPATQPTEPSDTAEGTETQPDRNEVDSSATVGNDQ